MAAGTCPWTSTIAVPHHLHNNSQQGVLRNQPLILRKWSMPTLLLPVFCSLVKSKLCPWNKATEPTAPVKEGINLNLSFYSFNSTPDISDYPKGFTQQQKNYITSLQMVQINIFSLLRFGFSYNREPLFIFFYKLTFIKIFFLQFFFITWVRHNTDKESK